MKPPAIVSASIATLAILLFGFLGPCGRTSVHGPQKVFTSTPGMTMHPYHKKNPITVEKTVIGASSWCGEVLAVTKDSLDCIIKIYIYVIFFVSWQRRQMRVHQELTEILDYSPKDSVSLATVHEPSNRLSSASFSCHRAPIHFCTCARCTG